MKLFAPMPLFCVLGLVAGGTMLTRTDWHQGVSSREPALRQYIPAKSVRERLLIAAADTDRGRRSARFETRFPQLTSASAAELAAELWEREKASPFQNDWYEFLRRWTELDPEAALTFARTNAGPLLENWLIVILPAWGSADPAAAARWWPTFVEREPERVSTALLGIWADQDWQTAVNWVESQKSGIVEVGFAHALAISAIPAHASEAQARIDAQLNSGGPPTTIEIAFFVSVAAHKLEHENDDALSWLASARTMFPCPISIAAECERRLIADASRLLAPNDEWGAWLTWLTGTSSESLPQASQSLARGRPDSGVQLFSTWLAADSESASRWLNGQRGSPCYNTFSSTLVWSIAAEEPASAFAWAMTIPSPTYRARLWTEWQRMGFPITPEVAVAIEQDNATISRLHQSIIEQLHGIPE